MLKLSTPNSLEESKIVFRAGIKTSHPSRPNLFSLVHLLARNSSNLKGIHGGEERRKREREREREREYNIPTQYIALTLLISLNELTMFFSHYYLMP